jgi:hypothetical protein
LARDLVLAATADGEGDGAAGVRALVRDRPDLLRGAVCVAGPGGHDLHWNGRVLVPIRVASLGFAFLRIRTHRGAREAVFALADLLLRLESGRLEPRMSDAGIAFLSAVNEALPRGRAIAMRGLRLGGLTSTIVKALDDPELAAMAADMMHDTVGLGEDVEVDTLAAVPAVETPADHPFLSHLFAAVRAARPGALPVPCAAFAGPEPAAFAELGIPTFGYAPIALPAGFDYRHRVRGVDESAPVDGIRAGMEGMADALLGWCRTA